MISLSFGVDMKIKIPGEMTVLEMRQCIIEQLFVLSDDFNIKHVRGINLYVTPTDGKGGEVKCIDKAGKEVTIMESEGVHLSSTDIYGL